MTTSANIDGVVKPLGMVRRDFHYGSGRVYTIGEITPRRKKKKTGYAKVGMIRIESAGPVEEASFTKPYGAKKDNLWLTGKKGGVWRTIRGRRYFFPLDGSSPTPTVKGGKKKGKGILAKVLGVVGIGGPKKKKKKSKSRESAAGIEQASDAMKKTTELLRKAKGSKGGKAVTGPLKAMQKALQNDDAKAFKKAEKSLQKAAQKLAKRKGQG